MMTPNVWNGAGRRIFMNEVGTRDGLQMEQAFVPTEDKIALVNALSEAGLSKIEVTAFVSPKAIPALRDGEIVMREIARRPGTVYTALVPNVRGAERAIDAQTDGSQSGDVGQRDAQPLQSAHAAQPVLRGTQAGDRHGAAGGNARQRVAFLLLWLSHGGRCVRGRSAGLGAALCRSGRAGHHAVRYHGHGLSQPGACHGPGLQGALAAGWV